jgi:hypothetical protein
MLQLFVSLLYVQVGFSTKYEHNDHIHEWVVHIDEGDDVADLVARDLGFLNRGQVRPFSFKDYQI